MARLTQDEQLKRLEKRYKELIKPSVIIAETVENGVEGVTILTNGKKEPFFFQSLEAFRSYADSLSNCNIIADSSVFAIKEKTMQAIFEAASADELRQIINEDMEPVKLRAMLYDGIIKELTI